MLYYIIAMAAGYAIGRIDTIVYLLKNRSHVDSIDSFQVKSSLLTEKKSANIAKRNIEIDERTYVTTVNTDNYVKSFDSIGKETVVSDNVSAAASKLSQLKNK